MVAVSPLIGNKAISGPAGDYMEAAGIEVNAYGLAKMYSDVCSNIVVDSKDKLLIKKIQNLDMKVYDSKLIDKLFSGNSFIQFEFECFYNVVTGRGESHKGKK